MHDIIARRQHDVRRRAAFLADQLERAGVVGLVGEHPPHQTVVDEGQILAVARRQRQHRLPGGRGTRRRHHRRDGGDRRLHDSRLRQGRRQARDRTRAGGRREIHRGPAGASGTDAGGTGGGRSENICAETVAGPKQSSAAASASAGRSRQAPPVVTEAIAPQSHSHAFHRKRGKFKPP